MKIPSKHLEVFQRHVERPILEAVDREEYYYFMIGESEDDTRTQEILDSRLSSARYEILQSGQLVPVCLYDVTTATPFTSQK
jgi:hypothetical protein